MEETRNTELPKEIWGKILGYHVATMTVRQSIRLEPTCKMFRDLIRAEIGKRIHSLQIVHYEGISRIGVRLL